MLTNWCSEKLLVLISSESKNVDIIIIDCNYIQSFFFKLQFGAGMCEQSTLYHVGFVFQ